MKYLRANVISEVLTVNDQPAGRVGRPNRVHVKESVTSSCVERPSVAEGAREAGGSFLPTASNSPRDVRFVCIDNGAVRSNETDVVNLDGEVACGGRVLGDVP